VTSDKGGNGGGGSEFDGTHGSGGGGGGGGGRAQATAGNGGTGADYGGGGGGGGYPQTGTAWGTSGAGGAGIIVVTYTPRLSTTITADYWAALDSQTILARDDLAAIDFGRTAQAGSQPPLEASGRALRDANCSNESLAVRNVETGASVEHFAKVRLDLDLRSEWANRLARYEGAPTEILATLSPEAVTVLGASAVHASQWPGVGAGMGGPTGAADVSPGRCARLAESGLAGLVACIPQRSVSFLDAHSNTV
jgi:hypothetical protein